MIQRIQTIYLALAFICTVLLLYFPVFSIEVTSPFVESTFAQLGPNGITSAEGNQGEFPLYTVFIVLAILSLVGIMLFKKRKRQLAITRFNFILHLVVVLGIYSVYWFGRGSLETALQKKDALLEGVEVIFKPALGFFLLIPAMVFVFLAIRGIKTDIKLTQMADRLR